MKSIAYENNRLGFPGFAVLLAPLAALSSASPPVISWTFDESRDTDAVQQAGEWLDSLQGAIELCPVCAATD